LQAQFDDDKIRSPNNHDSESEQDIGGLHGQDR
jgi:hypothetical protein